MTPKPQTKDMGARAIFYQWIQPGPKPKIMFTPVIKKIERADVTYG